MHLQDTLKQSMPVTPPRNNSLARKKYFFDAFLKPDTILSIPALWLEGDYYDESLTLISLGLILSTHPVEASRDQVVWRSKKYQELLLHAKLDNNNIVWTSSNLLRLGKLPREYYHSLLN